MHFVITHKQLNYEIPFDHKLIVVGDCVLDNSLNASDYIGNKLNRISALGGNRASPLLINNLETIEENEPIFTSSYRLFLSNNLEDVLYRPVSYDSRFIAISPADFQKKHQDIILQDIPNGYDLVIATPIDFGVSIMCQYATVHPLEDLLRGVALAIEMGIIEPLYASHVLKNNILIPYGYVAAKSKLKLQITKDMWSFAMNFFISDRKIHKKRVDYQSRFVDFVAERIFCIYIFQLITKKSLKFLSSRPIFIDDTGLGYVKSL